MEKRLVQYVMVTSKFCNLRCKYCYEFPDLGDRRAMTDEQIEDAFQKLAAFHRSQNVPARIHFAWHGGEPLLQPSSLYHRALDRQLEIFAGLEVTNGLQTNLTVLDDERIELLRRFDQVGVSLDLFGDLRVNAGGKPSQPKVLANLDKLIAAGIPFGGITVLTKLNLPHLDEVYTFWRELGAPFRLLPLHQGPFEQNQGFEIDAYDTLAAYCRIADLWLADEKMVVVNPIIEYVQHLLRCYDEDGHTYFYDKTKWEAVSLVDTDGEVYSYAEAFDKSKSHGNLFRQSMGEISGSAAHERSIAAAEARMDATCTPCPFFGRGCSGYPIAEGSMQYNERDERGAIRCIAERGLLEHLERRLTEMGMIQPSRRVRVPAPSRQVVS